MNVADRDTSWFGNLVDDPSLRPTLNSNIDATESNRSVLLRVSHCVCVGDDHRIWSSLVLSTEKSKRILTFVVVTVIIIWEPQQSRLTNEDYQILSSPSLLVGGRFFFFAKILRALSDLTMKRCEVVTHIGGELRSLMIEVMWLCVIQCPYSQENRNVQNYFR